ncbi:MAG: Gx transporter family protein [Acetivibrionales bacterium]
MSSTKKLVLIALFVSQALVLSIIESWIPLPVAIPGVKLGLSNIITLIAIIFFGFKEAIIIVIIRTFLASLYTGGFSVLLFSITGGVLSAIVMALLYKKFASAFSIIGISVAGAIMHNIGQLMVASLIMQELSVFFYLPVLLVSGILTGCFVGLCTNFLAKALNKTKLFDKDWKL